VRYFRSRRSARPRGEASSRASSVPSRSGFAALKRPSTTARYSRFAQGSVPVGVCFAELGAAQATAQFLHRQRAVLVAVELVEQRGCRSLHFPQVERAVSVRIEPRQSAVDRRGARQRWQAERARGVARTNAAKARTLREVAVGMGSFLWRIEAGAGLCPFSPPPRKGEPAGHLVPQMSHPDNGRVAGPIARAEGPATLPAKNKMVRGRQ
jgi:hypothetical protein